MTSFEGTLYRALGDVDWENWTPIERATLLFVVRDGHILLIHKKRGIGAGKVNGPGGRIDPGESAYDGAIREVCEELYVTPTGVRQIGELKFQFTDGHSILCYVFTATGCDGDPVDTEEATPLWTPIDQIPFELMWDDDRIWMPLMLKGVPFKGRALFHGEQMLGHEITAM
jgi:8-oxo-dGTP diphosphatase